MKRKEMILRTCELTSDFLIHISEEKKWYYTFPGLQVVFSIHTREKRKWYSTLVESQVFSKIHVCEKKIILHTCKFTSKSLLRNRKQNQIIIKNPIWFWLKSQLGTNHEFDFGLKIL
jgi:hypothetical protein